VGALSFLFLSHLRISSPHDARPHEAARGQVLAEEAAKLLVPAGASPSSPRDTTIYENPATSAQIGRRSNRAAQMAKAPVAGTKAIKIDPLRIPQRAVGRVPRLVRRALKAT